MEEEKYKGSIPEATVVKDGKNQKKISCFTRTVVHYPCVVMLISGVISIILVAIVGSGDSFRLGSSWMNFDGEFGGLSILFRRREGDRRVASWFPDCAEIASG